MLARTFIRSALSSANFIRSSQCLKTTGTVKFFDSVKGFGFLTPMDGSEDVFVHQTSIQKEGFRSLAEGEEVEFDIETSQKNGKLVALNVTGPGGKPVVGQTKKPASNGGGRREREDRY